MFTRDLPSVFLGQCFPGSWGSSLLSVWISPPYIVQHYPRQSPLSGLPFLCKPSTVGWLALYVREDTRVPSLEIVVLTPLSSEGWLSQLSGTVCAQGMVAAAEMSVITTEIGISIPPECGISSSWRGGHRDYAFSQRSVVLSRGSVRLEKVLGFVFPSCLTSQEQQRWPLQDCHLNGFPSAYNLGTCFFL